MKTRDFLTIILFALLQSCVTERVNPEKPVAKKLYGAKLKLGDIKIESRTESHVEEALITTQLKSLRPGFYQLVIADGTQCPAVKSALATNEKNIETDPFYVTDAKPQTIIRQAVMKSNKNVAVVAEKKDDQLSVVDCAPIRPAVMK